MNSVIYSWYQWNFKNIETLVDLGWQKKQNLRTFLIWNRTSFYCYNPGISPWPKVIMNIFTLTFSGRDRKPKVFIPSFYKNANDILKSSIAFNIRTNSSSFLLLFWLFSSFYSLFFVNCNQREEKGFETLQIQPHVKDLSRIFVVRVSSIFCCCHERKKSQRHQFLDNRTFLFFFCCFQFFLQICIFT